MARCFKTKKINVRKFIERNIKKKKGDIENV